MADESISYLKLQRHIQKEHPTCTYWERRNNKYKENKEIQTGQRRKNCCDLNACNPCGCFCRKKAFDLDEWKPKDEIPFHPCDDIGFLAPSKRCMRETSDIAR